MIRQFNGIYGKIPSHQYSWNDTKNDWVYKEEDDKLLRICRVTGRLEEVKKVPIGNQHEFEFLVKTFHHKPVTKVDLTDVENDDYKRIGYGVSVDLNELNNEQPFDDAHTLQLECEVFYRDNQKEIAFIGEFVAQRGPVILLDQVKIFPTDEDRTYLIERLCQMGLSKEDVDTLGIHHYIL